VPETIHVEGYREVVRALDRVNRKSKRTLLAALRAGAEPIASDARGRLARYNEISLSTIRPAAQQRGVMVIQRKKRVTGKRPDFGALQMTHGLIPALQDHRNEIPGLVETAFSTLITMEGL